MRTMGKLMVASFTRTSTCGYREADAVFLNKCLLKSDLVCTQERKGRDQEIVGKKLSFMK